ncbi:non-ribosomal peptide synthetase [Ganoderma sinense ZZ0214-1]|uniref:Non-ribosomal peptide synthetase n=1 Tax=Ganoderma sinense ZZ0214-1 TaxID=1077348 RepID=A0A2G8RR80_9APHY|nr:non-ribosomal peptide synthetase [Ganoderma sinense ZZ0214-1]
MSTTSLTASGSPPSTDIQGGHTDYDQVFSGYTHYDFPDLSSRRFAPDSLQTVSQSLGPGAEQDTTVPFTTLVAATARVLGAYCSCRDTLLALSDVKEAAVLPVRVQWAEATTWKDAAAAISNTLTDPRCPRIHPDLLRRALNLSPKQSPALALLTPGPLLRSSLGGYFPIVLVADQESAQLSIIASERVLHPSQSTLLLSQIVALAKYAISTPQASMDALPQLPSDLLSSYDKQSIETRLSTEHLVPLTKYATDHLTLRALESPDAIGVRWYPDLSTDIPISSYVPETLTNAEFDQKANRLGRWLLRTGLKKGRSVAICMKRDLWFHIAFIGVLRAGGCYVPIDAELPAERQQFIVKDSDAQFILSTSDLPCFSALGSIAIDFMDPVVREAVEAQSAQPLQVPDPDDLAYILYTSGTTGTPKGCILTHRGLGEAIWALSQFCAAAELTPPGKVNYLSLASVAFDVHIAEIMVALAVGIPILSAPRSLLLEDLPYYITHLRVSHVGIVPSLIEATMGAVQEGEDAGRATTLRYIASGGEKMSDAILDKWADHPKVRLANFYGPSEVTIGCAARMMDMDTPRANIGHTLPNVAAYIVDDNMNIVLRGVPGELVVEGPLVGHGYVGRPDLSQKVFLKFPDDGTERWAYRTGDLVRMMADGTLEIIGRIDTQIKLRGVRIESEGISSIIRNAAPAAHPLDVLTILAKHPSLGVDQLVSFISWDTSVAIRKRKGGTPSVLAPPEGLLRLLRDACDRELASYMRPSHIIPLDFIPLSSNGKADAKVLAALFLVLDLDVLTGLMTGDRSTSTSGEDRAELTEAGRKVVKVLGSHTKVPLDRIGPYANLFECGLDSMAITRFAADLRKVFGVTVSPARIMQSPVVSSIVALIDSYRLGPTVGKVTASLSQFVSLIEEETAAAYSADVVASLLPPFPVQEGILYRSANSPTMYVQHVLMRLAPNTSVRVLRNAWSEVVTQHEILRTVFHFGSNLVQVLLRPGSFVPQVVEEMAPEIDDAGFQGHFTKQEASIIAREMNIHISEVPPVRLSLYNSSQSSPVYAVLSIHHALYDGIALPVLLQDLERAYFRQPQLPSASLREALEHVTLLEQGSARAFWTSYLKGYPWERLLNQSASSAVADVRSNPFKLPLSELRSKAAEQQVTLQALLMAAYGSLLSQHFYGHDDVMFGVIRTGRTIPVDHVETTICPMITVVPARVRLNEPSKVLQTVQQDISRVSEYEHVPLSRIQKWVQESDQSLFDTLFSVSFKEKGESKLWTVLESQNPEPDYVLAVEVVLDPEQDTAVVHAAYTPSDISSELVLDILGQLETTAVRMTDDGDWSLPSHSSLSAAPRQGFAVALVDDLDDLTDVDQDLVVEISAISSAFLRVDSNLIKAETSLLSLGLDSIKSVGLSRRLSSQDYRLSSADIMKLSTPIRLAAFIQRSKASKPSETCLSDAVFAAECAKLANALGLDTVKLSGDDSVKVYPTTILQAGMLSQTVSSRGRLYVHLFPIRLAHDIDIDRLRQAWEKTIASFDILRTSFHFLPGSGVWSQVVHSNAPMSWSQSQCDPGTNLTESLNPLLDLSDERDFFRRPPIFFHLLKATSSSDAHRLVLVLHHALYDGLAIAKLFHAVEQLYFGSYLSVDTQYHQLLPNLLWQEENGTPFWTNNLRDLHHASLPRKATPPSEISALQVSLPVPVTHEEMREASRDAEVTLQCIGQTAFAKLLAVITHRRDVIFGRVVSGRDLPGSEEVLGPMLNTVPCRVLFQEGVANKTLMKHIHRANVASMPWQHASLRAIQRELHVIGLWDSLFVFQPSQESLDSTSRSPWMFDAADGEDIFVHYPLNVELHETKYGFVVKAACTPGVADFDGLRELVEQYATILCAIVRCPDDPWTVGIPEIPFDSLSANNIVVSVGAQDGSEVWDNPFHDFRELLSTATKVPSSKILPRTHLAALGIDSITAVQIVAKARRLNLRLTAVEIFRSRTVGDLLQKLEKSGSTAVNGVVKAASANIPQTRWSTILPSHVHELVERVTNTSPGMEWMIGMWQRSEGSRFQHAFGFRVASDIDSTRLQDAWHKLIRRHAVLRSTFAYDKELGAPLVIIYKAGALNSLWMEEVLPALDDELVQHRMKTLVSHPPPMDRPLTRAVFLKSSRERYLLIQLHHFQYDAWSLPLLVDDLLHIYAGEPPKSSNDLDSFLVSTAHHTETEQEQARYWKTVFAESRPPTLFPALCKQPASPVRSVYTDYSAISGAVELDKRSRDLAITLQSVFLASWAQVYGNHAASDNIAFSLWHSGRTGNLKDVERLAVPCINALPFRVLGASRDDTLALARQIQNDLQARSAVVEQSRLVNVHEWAGIGDSPLSNVFVNIVKTAPDIEETNDGALKSLNLPYYIPEESLDVTVGTTMRVTNLIQDDIMIDIIVDHATDQVVMSIEFAGTILDTGSAKSLLGEWATRVRAALSVGHQAGC